MKFKPDALYLTVKDHSVSGESFELYHDKQYDLLFTHPQPSLEKLPSYYESEDYISHTDGKRSLFERVYQSVKEIALKRKLQLINSFEKQPGRLLDIGAGTGDFLRVAQQAGWQTTGFEPSDKARGIAIAKGVSFVSDTSELEDSSIDVITMWHVLEHVPDLDRQLSELKRLLKPTGTLVVAVPNFRSADAQTYGTFWAAFDVPRHLWHFSKTAIAKLFAEKQMTVVQVLPMVFDAYYVSLLSEKYQNGKMNFLKAFWNGWRSNQRASASKEHSSHIYVIKNT